MRTSILTMSFGIATLTFALPVSNSETGSLIPRLDLVGGTTATYTIDSGTDTRGMSSGAGEHKARDKDGLESRNLVKDGFGRGAYGIEAASVVDVSTESTG
ncbi:hypothetical protein DL98DRAFT_111737 [Cadophora sp. DSE1049]|nr:hypothetical protein DL98DRAFT_111737 [Cadophora sp. DSE1049]